MGLIEQASRIIRSISVFRERIRINSEFFNVDFHMGIFTYSTNWVLHYPVCM